MANGAPFRLHLPASQLWRPVLLLVVLLLVSLTIAQALPGVSSYPATKSDDGESFVQSSVVQWARHPQQDRNACKLVPSPAGVTDAPAVHETTCASVCRAQPGYATHSSGDIVVTDGGVQCKCCDPASSARMLVGTAYKADSSGSQCKPGVDFGIQDVPASTSPDVHDMGERALFVKDTCSGLFLWQGQQVTGCVADALDTDTKICPYNAVSRHMSQNEVTNLDQRMKQINKSDVQQSLHDLLSTDDVVKAMAGAAVTARTERDLRALDYYLSIAGGGPSDE